MGDFEINVLNGVWDILDNFESVDSNNPKVLKPLRISKNGKKMDGKKEKMQSLPKKFELLNNRNQVNEIDFEENWEKIIFI